MIKLKFSIISIFIFCNVYSQVYTFPYDTVKFDKVGLYYISNKKCDLIKYKVIVNDSVNKCYSLKCYLKPNDIKKIRQILIDTLTYGATDLSCSLYDYGIVFFNNQHIAGYISISLQCDKVFSSLPIYGNEYYKIKYDDYYTYSCFSKIGKKKLSNYFNKKGLKNKFEYRN